jgi:hypothetical protein
MEEIHNMNAMKHISLAIVLVIEGPLMCMAEPNIPIKQQVILKQVPERFRYKEFWEPTEKETQTALATIMAFVHDPKQNDRELEKIQSHYGQYYVQFIGILVEGKRRLFCNFFLVDESLFSERLKENWQEKLIRVRDGGFYYWRIEYDLETGKCLNFESNGYA